MAYARYFVALAFVALVIGCGPDKEKVELVRHAVHQAEETIATIRKGEFDCCNKKVQDLVYSAEKLKRDRCNEALVESSTSTIDALHKVALDDQVDIDEFSDRCAELNALNKKRLQSLDENLEVARTGVGEVKDVPGSLSELKKLIGQQEEIARRRLLRWKQINY